MTVFLKSSQERRQRFDKLARSPDGNKAGPPAMKKMNIGGVSIDPSNVSGELLCRYANAQADGLPADAVKELEMEIWHEELTALMFRRAIAEDHRR